MNTPDNRTTTQGKASGARPYGAAPAPAPALEPALGRFGRASVLALRLRDRRQIFAATLSVHPLLPVPQPGGATSAPEGIGSALAMWMVDGPPPGVGRFDWHLRRELVARLLEQAASQGVVARTPDCGLVLAWSRPGPACSEDADHRWWSASSSAADEVGLPLTCLLVVTRWGWWTLPEGPSRCWARLRNRGGPLAPHAPAPAGYPTRRP